MTDGGDLGRAKVRQRRKWFSRKYYASVMNIKEFYEDDIAAIVTQAMEMMAKKQELERDRKSRDEGLESSE
ncbi:MAG: hypothetical protein J5565_00280 [Muribaculaceae bacterium]|nr:hypothetical protein [Muribaculaceae bacterium]